MGRPAEICNWSPVQRKWQRFQLRAHYDGCQLWPHHNPDFIHTGAEVWQYSPAILSLTIGVTTHISSPLTLHKRWSKSLSFCTNTVSYLINCSLYRSPHRTICAHPTPSILFCEKNNMPLKTCHLFTKQNFSVQSLFLLFGSPILNILFPNISIIPPLNMLKPS